MRPLRRVCTIAATLAATIGLALPAQALTHAGDAIQIQRYATTSACTLTGVRTDSHGQQWGVTASHCFVDNGRGAVLKVVASDGTVLAGNRELSRTIIHNDIPGKGDLKDIAMFPLIPGTEVDATHIYSRPSFNEQFQALSSNNPLADLWNRPLPLGAPLPVTADLVGRPACQEGASTGRTCGFIVQANPATGDIVAIVPTIEGDSGGPLHVLGADGKQHVVGSLTGGSVLLINSFDSPLQYQLP